MSVELKDWALKKSREKPRDFFVGPVVKTPLFQYRKHWFDPWSGKLRMPQGVNKNRLFN